MSVELDLVRIEQAAGPELFNWDDFTEMSGPQDLAKIFQTTEYAKWRSFRESEDSRFVGMFRTHGRLVPVWDLPSGTGAAVLEGPAAEFGQAVEAALGDASPLSGEERAARSGLANRQLTIR